MRWSARRRSLVGHCASTAASVYNEVKGVSLPVKDLCQIHHGKGLPFQLRQLDGIDSRPGRGGYSQARRVVPLCHWSIMLAYFRPYGVKGGHCWDCVFPPETSMNGWNG